MVWISWQFSKTSLAPYCSRRASSSKQTHHMDIWYCFVTNSAASSKVGIEYCPTKEMLGDFFTKPLQGSLFCYFWDCIMNIYPSTYMLKDQRSMLKNRLEKGKEILETKLRKIKDKRTYSDFVKDKGVRWKERSDSQKQVRGKQCMMRKVSSL